MGFEPMQWEVGIPLERGPGFAHVCKAPKHIQGLHWHVPATCQVLPSHHAVTVRGKGSPVSAGMRVHTHTHTHSLSLTHTHSHIHTHSHSHTLKHTHTHTHTPGPL